MATMPGIRLLGRVLLRGSIRAETGLHIGGAAGALAIGGVDNPVVRDPLTNTPYVPGSSLKGKMRSLTEKAEGRPKNYPPRSDSQFHVCERAEEYVTCRVCRVFGVPGEKPFAFPTRLVVRDVFMEEGSKRRLEEARTDLPYTEVKWEVAIDRVTSQANPRQMERVPAGTVFGPMELVYSVYEDRDVDDFAVVLRALRLVEDDYLGGQGSRGSGKVRFQGLELLCKANGTLELPEEVRDRQSFDDLDALLERRETVLRWVHG
ncbi:MAG TPA: type III-A CRISPR-associated RAMP protein Csm3, partial [Chloroflexota bacterium]